MGGNFSAASDPHDPHTRLLSSSEGGEAPAPPTALSHTPLECLAPFLLGGIADKQREVGSGSFAVVKEFEVRGKRCAGKKLHLSLYESASQERREDLLTRFARECKLLQGVKHPNIVRFLGVYVEADSQLPYLIMEYLDITLAGYLQKNGVPEAPVYYNILSDVALGLRYMHQQSPPIIHRDLSANNVLLSASLQAKISDLGVSKVLDISPTQKTRITQTQAPGTLCYMPPEALVEKPKYDESIDIFSFGVLIIHTLCSDWPIPGAPTQVDPNNQDTILPVTEFERRHHYIARIGLDHPALPLVRKCLHNNTDSRPDITAVTSEIVELQLKSDEGKVHYPRVSYEAKALSDISVAIGDKLMVLGNGRKTLKTYSTTSSEVGYIPAHILRQLPQCPVATALYSYTADTGDGISVTEGDSLHILSIHNPEWWYALCLETGQAGFIPSNYVSENLESYRWYLGNTSHAEADNLLKQGHNTSGSYLIHDECQDIRCLSLRGRDSIMHYKIDTSKDGSIFIVKETTFKTLQDLVYHYSQTADVLCSTLRYPYHVPQGDDEIDRSSVKLSYKMKKGHFGEVWKGLKGKSHVVVKTLTPGATTSNEFLKESVLIAQLDHPKIIKCEGVCTKEEPIYVIMEFMKFGNLQDYLQKGEGKEVHFLDLVSLGVQIASGMAYLERQSYIHCDLAAYSVLVGEQKVCKIANFRKARRAATYKLPPRTQVPVRWTAPEVFNTNEYTIKSDVWSFGVVLHEIVTRGERPYNHMSNEETHKAVQSGYRMPRSEGCPQGLYEMMLKCWQEDPGTRLRFEAVEWQLEEFFISKCFEDRTYIAPFQMKH